MSDKVGIVIVSYNASTAVRVTLASLRAVAGTEPPNELVLVDNASREDERQRIAGALSRHVAEAGLPWKYVQQQQNLGFSGGNNVGIRMLLQDPSVTHVCLLNSDVIVPEGWLASLLACRRDIVSCVTDKADGEQCVPVDYTLRLESCLDEGAERLRDGPRQAVEQFARRRRRAFPGHVVACDVTFFCVLISRSAIERIGLLDEKFFPGGFEDDDYCARAHALGMDVHLARDVYVHHWGSASFGQLDLGYFSEKAGKNRRYLEQKHGMEWRRRPERPFVSLAMDLAFAATGNGSRADQRHVFGLFQKSLGKLLGVYLREFESLRAALSVQPEPAPPALLESVAAAEAPRERLQEWRSLSREIDAAIGGAAGSGGSLVVVREGVERLSRAVYEVATATLAMHEHLQAAAKARGDSAPSGRPQGTLRRLWSMFRHGVPFLLRLRAIVFFGGYPSREREKDGYFQRIRAIDDVFDDRWCVYVDESTPAGTGAWYSLPEPRTLVLHSGGGIWRRLLVTAVVWVVALRCRRVYFHSVLRLETSRFAWLMSVPGIRKVLDVHGVVPEEFRMHGDFFSAVHFEDRERLAVRKAHAVVVVTEAMRRYLLQKYRDRLRGEVVVLPMFPVAGVPPEPRPYSGGKPVVVYAGGLHKWQQVPKMIDAIVETHHRCLHRFYCPDPAPVVAMLPADLLANGGVVVESKSHDELVECYRDCHFGFVLREDLVVNHVACPTKLVEYLAMGIVPIVDCEDIGDFKELGMRFVRLRDFVEGLLPEASARDAMARENHAVHARLRGQRQAGVDRLRRIVGAGIASGGAAERLLWRLAQWFPVDTRRGRLARRVWRLLGAGQPASPAEPAGSPPGATGPAAAATGVPELAPCDVLVQVGNFVAGGLENVVLDLNEKLQQAGFRVTLLVLGEAGPAVARAQAQGVSVTVASFSDAAYRHWLAAARPKVVMSHYSVEGAAVCGQVGVPLLQVIHNVYLWLDARQQGDLRESVPHTSLFVAVSDFARDYSVERLGVPGARCVVVPNGIDVARFRRPLPADERQKLRDSLGIGPREFVFLTVGAVNHQKNHLSLVRSFAACAEACPEARLLVVGPLHERSLLHECRKVIERSGLASRVTFVGGVEDPHRYYAAADAYVHPAFFEGGPLVLLEALAADLPVVATATGLAVHFAGRPGIELVPPHFAVGHFRGHLTTMKADSRCEALFTTAMQRTYQNRVRPGLPAAIVDAFDRDRAYDQYVELVRGLAAAGSGYRPALADGWPEMLRSQQSDASRQRSS